MPKLPFHFKYLESEFDDSENYSNKLIISELKNEIIKLRGEVDYLQGMNLLE